jgi:hypothetical protein
MPEKQKKKKKTLQPPKPKNPPNLWDRMKQIRGKKKTYSDIMKDLFPDG